MDCITTGIEDLVVFEPDVYHDERGHFLELWSTERSAYAERIEHAFVQDNLSKSKRGVLRGLHFQNPTPQGKLVTVLSGEVWDVAVDIRQGSPTFGDWFGIHLSGDAYRQLFVPEGFAHGFVVLSDTALFQYKCTAPYRPDAEQSIHWNDPEIGIEWPLDAPILSEKDAKAPRMEELPDAAFEFPADEPVQSS
jgi:dTDP-4-dehydrorhamnose 3,5-epimerase